MEYKQHFLTAFEAELTAQRNNRKKNMSELYDSIERNKAKLEALKIEYAEAEGKAQIELLPKISGLKAAIETETELLNSLSGKQNYISDNVYGILEDIKKEAPEEIGKALHNAEQSRKAIRKAIADIQKSIATIREADSFTTDYMLKYARLIQRAQNRPEEYRFTLGIVDKVMEPNGRAISQTVGRADRIRQLAFYLDGWKEKAEQIERDLTYIGEPGK